MPNEFRQRVARLNKQELDDMPAPWTRRERGHHLRRLLVAKGIDPNRLYRLEFYPHRACWLFTQDAEPGSPASSPSAQTDEAFYLQIRQELSRAARSALGSSGTLFGARSQLPPEPQELTPSDLLNLIGDDAPIDSRVRFDGEGGWQPHALGE
jgi:hypothetical protein